MAPPRSLSARLAARASYAEALAVVLRWLGPWAGERVPEGISRTIGAVGEGDRVRIAWYRREGRPPIGAYLVVQGLHYLGPDDPRLDRFCRVLARAGFLVAAPYLPEPLALRIDPRTGDDLALAWDELARVAEDEKLPEPAVFSVSFGSLPAIQLAARRDVGALVLFGGYADFDATLRFAIEGEPGRPRDPLNAPAVFLNLLPRLDVGEHATRLTEAWRSVVLLTWGRAEHKQPGVRDPIVHEVARSLPETVRELFLVGCGIRPGAADVVARALEGAEGDVAFLDPRPHLARVRAPVVILHGRGDDVIPWEEAPKLRAALPDETRVSLFLTGFYAHTGAELPKIVELGREARTLFDLARALVAAPLGML